jgi:hypothetical protein
MSPHLMSRVAEHDEARGRPKGPEGEPEAELAWLREG